MRAAILLFAVCLSTGAWAAGISAGTMSGGTTTVDKPLDVKGQTRTLSMMLVLKSKKEKINFITVRRQYHDEILATKY